MDYAGVDHSFWYNIEHPTTNIFFDDMEKAINMYAIGQKHVK